MRWLLAASMTLAGVANAETADIESFLKDFAARRDAIETFQCRFTQITLTSSDAAESTGTLVFVKPRRILFLYDEPKLQYMVDNLTMYEYDPDLEQIRIDTLEDKPEADALFLGFERDIARLREAYDVSLATKEESQAEGKVLKLIPKTVEGERPLFEKILLYLRDTDYLPYRLQIRNTDNDVTYEFSDYVVNDSAAKPQSTIRVPAGTDVVRGDAPNERVGEGGKEFPDAAPAPTAKP